MTRIPGRTYVRITVDVTERQFADLEALRVRVGINRARFIRRAITAHLKLFAESVEGARAEQEAADSACQSMPRQAARKKREV